MSDSSDPKTSAALRRARFKAAAAANHSEIMTTLRMLLLKMDHVVSKLDGCEHKVELATAGLALLANKELAAMPSMPLSLLEPADDRQVEQSTRSLEALPAPLSAEARKPTG